MAGLNGTFNLNHSEAVAITTHIRHTEAGQP